MKNIKNILLLIAITTCLVACNNNNKNIDASGTFEATDVIVSSEANGKIIQFDLELGQEVKAGQTLGCIDTIQLHLKKMQLLASMDAVGKRRLDINKQIAAIEEQVNNQKLEKARMERLIEAKAGNQKQLDDLNASIAILERQITAQKSSLESNNAGITGEQLSMEIQVQQIDDQISKSFISSPIDGTVIAKYAEVGEVTAMGKPLFKVADIQNLWLKAYIISAQLNQLKIGDKVTVKSDFGDKGSRTYDGTVVWISDQAEFSPKTIQTKDERANLVYAVKIAVKNDGYLKIGMYGDLVFQPTSSTQAQ